MRKVTTHEAKTHLSQLLAQVQTGDQILICRGATPIARLVPLNQAPEEPKRPPVGTVTSKPIQCSADAFAPLTDGELQEWGL